MNEENKISSPEVTIDNQVHPLVYVGAWIGNRCVGAFKSEKLTLLHAYLKARHFFQAHVFFGRSQSDPKLAASTKPVAHLLRSALAAMKAGGETFKASEPDGQPRLLPLQIYALHFDSLVQQQVISDPLKGPHGEQVEFQVSTRQEDAYPVTLPVMPPAPPPAK